jgi:hypothetical protein
MSAPEGSSRLPHVALVVAVVALVAAGASVAVQSGRFNALEARVGALEEGTTRSAASEGDAEPCMGTIAQALVQESVGRHGPGVFRCYEEMRAEKPDFRGTLVADLEVDARGRVADVTFGGTLDEERFLDCIREDLVAWHFPPPVGGVCAVVRAPFALSASTADAGTP